MVAEILDNQTLDLIDNSPVDDAVISTEFLSNLMLQVVRNPFLETIYRELLNAGGVEMGFRPVSKYIKLDEDVTHRTVVKEAQKVNETVIGYKIEKGIKSKVILNPNKNVKFRFTNKDQLIVLAQQLYI